MNRHTTTAPITTTTSDVPALAEPSDGGPLVTLLRVAFVATLVVFLLGGFVLVAAQAFELALGHGTAVSTLSEKLGPPTFTVATVCGLLAFLHEYVAPHRGGEQG
jgi:hypothetical protein